MKKSYDELADIEMSMALSELQRDFEVSQLYGYLKD
jgi:hypothetical protein